MISAFISSSRVLVWSRPASGFRRYTLVFLARYHHPLVLVLVLHFHSQSAVFFYSTRQTPSVLKPVQTHRATKISFKPLCQKHMLFRLHLTLISNKPRSLLSASLSDPAFPIALICLDVTRKRILICRTGDQQEA